MEPKVGSDYASHYNITGLQLCRRRRTSLAIYLRCARRSLRYRGWSELEHGIGVDNIHMNSEPSWRVSLVEERDKGTTEPAVRHNGGIGTKPCARCCHARRCHPCSGAILYFPQPCSRAFLFTIIVAESSYYYQYLPSLFSLSPSC